MADMDETRVAARGSLEDGAAVLAKPLTAETPDGKLRLKGRLGLSKGSDLDGTLALTPEALASLTGGKLKLDEAMPVPFNVRGSLAQPQFDFEVDRVVKVRKQVDKVLERSGVPKPSKKAKKQVEKKLREIF